MFLCTNWIVKQMELKGRFLSGIVQVQNIQKQIN